MCVVGTKALGDSQPLKTGAAEGMIGISRLSMHAVALAGALCYIARGHEAALHAQHRHSSRFEDAAAAQLQLQPSAHRRARLAHASLPHAQPHVHKGCSMRAASAAAASGLQKGPPLLLRSKEAELATGWVSVPGIQCKPGECPERGDAHAICRHLLAHLQSAWSVINLFRSPIHSARACLWSASYRVEVCTCKWGPLCADSALCADRALTGLVAQMPGNSTAQGLDVIASLACVRQWPLHRAHSRPRPAKWHPALFPAYLLLASTAVPQT